LSGDHVCGQGHHWQDLAACPVCGAAPRTDGDPTASEANSDATLPADVVAPAVTAFPTLSLPEPPAGGAPPAELPHVAGYETLRVLGWGGMGVVYLAWQTGLARLVALKTVLAGAHVSPEQRARFHTEAEAAARLQHPDIVQIYEVGNADGQPYLAMEYVEGGSLAARLNGKPQPAPAAADLVARLAEAVHHAHQRGIVHRDLKPANILLREKRTTDHTENTDKKKKTNSSSVPSVLSVVDFEPKITDFGLAKLLLGGVSQTATGAILGTPAYMAPEQAGGTAPVGPATDVYALGTILYELLTGRPPFLATGVLETLEEVRRQEPVPPRRLVATVPRDLETICLKCLEKDPARRYESALALAEDLRRYAAGEPVRARPVAAWERGVRWVRRHPARAALLVVSCLAVLALTGAAVGLAYNARLQTLNTDLEDAVAQTKASRDALSRLERWLRYVRDVRFADEAWHGGQVQRLKPLLDGCPSDLRGWEWYYLRGLRQKDGQTLTHRSWVLSVTFDPEGHRLASGCSDGSVSIWDLDTATGRPRDKGRPSPKYQKGGVWGVTFSPNGRLLASAGDDHSVLLWNPDDGQVVRKLQGHTGPVRSVAFRPDGKVLASASKDGTIKLWDAERGDVLHTLAGHKGGALAVAFAPGGKRLASAGADAVVRLWDPDQGALVRELSGHTREVHGVAFSADGKLLVSAGSDGTVRTWDPASGQPRTVYLPGQATALYGVAFGPGGQIATAGEDHHLRVWDGSVMRTFRGHQNHVQGVAFSPDGRRVATASRDRTVKLWKIDTDQQFRAFLGPGAPMLGARFSPDGRRLTSVAEDGTVREWDADSGKLLRRRTANLDRPRSVAIRLDGGFLTAAGRHGKIARWDLANDRPIPATWQHGAPARAVAVSPDGRRVASTGEDGTVKIWDTAGETALFTRGEHTAPVRAVVFSPDGKSLVSGGEDGVRVWDVATGRELPTWVGKTPKVAALAFGPDGCLAVAQMGGHLSLWDPERRLRRVALLGHNARVWAVAFTPDGTRLASASQDMTVKLWDTASGHEVLTLRDFPGEVSGVAFSPDGRRLVTTDLGGSVRLWETDREQASGP
jgi:WD40 repeat protein